MTKELTCIGCPLGCAISAQLDDNNSIISISGHTCNIGKKYAMEELTLPKRMVTALINVKGSKLPLSVKTSKPIEKSKIFDCLKELKKYNVTLPVKVGDIILKNICDTDVDIVSTRNMY